VPLKQVYLRANSANKDLLGGERGKRVVGKYLQGKFSSIER